MQNVPDAINAVKNGEIVVLPTDTVYGICASAKDVDAVERVYELKDRSRDKAVIVLIAQASDMQQFTIKQEWISSAEELWENSDEPLSIAVPCQSKRWRHISRDTHFIAFRLPKDEPLRQLLNRSGPVIAPSANPEGLPPAFTAEEARSYFGDTVQVYVDGGERDSKPSRVLRLGSESNTVIRE